MGFNDGSFNEGPFGGAGTGGATGVGVLVSDLVYDAYRRAGIMLAPDRTPSDPMVHDGLRALNRFMGGLNTQANAIITKALNIWDTVAGQQIYTLGPGGDWDGAVPPKISKANLLISRDPDMRQPLAILDADEWGDITYDDVLSYPSAIYCDGSVFAGLTRIYCYPIPNGAYGIELYTWQGFPTTLGISDELFFPDGYEEMIVLQLATRLMPMFRKRLNSPLEDQLVIDQARMALGRVKAMNSPTVRLSTDAPSCSCGDGGWFDWITGEIK